jgi:tRNA threonylcarbamoyladenosine biosynthesis protein TsaB
MNRVSMPPVVLGIDSSGSWCSVALLHARATHVRRAEVGHAHSEHLLAQVDAVLAEAAIGLAECDVIAFSAGPGSFTGLRVACAAAQGMAFGVDRPVAAIGTLAALANSVKDLSEDRRMLVAHDARMGEVYWSLFERTDRGWICASGPALSAPGHLLDLLLEDGQALPIGIGCGNAWAVHGAAMAGLVERVVHRDAADAVDVAELGAAAWREGSLVAAADAAPVYIRNHVASTTAERALRMREGVPQ